MQYAPTWKVTPMPAIWQAFADFLANRRSLAWGVLLAALVTSCDKPKSNPTSAPRLPQVEIIHPQKRTITREVGQPSFVESYERTSIFPKVNGYIKKWYVDIGDVLKKGDTLCTLFVPELEEDLRTKNATVVLDRERINLAVEEEGVAAANVETAKARLDEAKANLAKYQADVDRWDTEVKRLTREVKNGVVDPQVLLESTNQLKANIAARDAAKSTIAAASSEVRSRKAMLAKAKVDVGVARADLAVAASDAKRLEAWNGYLTITAPYDCVVVARNANTGDFVLPAQGDPTADPNAPHLGPGGKTAPIYVVERRDIVRIFVDVPEGEADFVTVGTKARVLCRAYQDRYLTGTVTRTSWSLNVKSRTLRAEIDLPNPGGRILPGMYAYGKIIIERANVWTLPHAALTISGDQTYYWSYEKDADGKGRSMRTDVQTGLSDDKWVEVTEHRKADESSEGGWAPIDGSEQVITAEDLSILSDGSLVSLRSATASEKTKAGK